MSGKHASKRGDGPAGPRRLEGGLSAGGEEGAAHSLQALAQLSPGPLQASSELGLLGHQGQPGGHQASPEPVSVNQILMGGTCVGSLVFSPHGLPLSPAE